MTIHQEQTVEGLLNTAQSLVPDMHPSVWTLIILLLKEEILAKKEEMMLNKKTNQRAKKPSVTL